MTQKRENLEGWLIVNDAHYPFHDQLAITLVKQFAKDFKPDGIVFNGDWMDCFEISKYDKVPRYGKNLQEEIDLVKQDFESWRKVAPDAKMIWLEGNHEFRMRQYLIRRAEHLFGLRALEVPLLFDLAKFNIEWKPCKEGLSKFSHNFIKIGALYVGHWDKVAKHSAYTAKALVEEKGVSILQGHCHRGGSHLKTLANEEVLAGYENFCLCDLNPSYISLPNWQQGFSVVYKEKGHSRFMVEQIPMVKHEFIFGGKHYHL